MPAIYTERILYNVLVSQFRYYTSFKTRIPKLGQHVVVSFIFWRILDLNEGCCGTYY